MSTIIIAITNDYGDSKENEIVYKGINNVLYKSREIER